MAKNRLVIKGRRKKPKPPVSAASKPGTNMLSRPMLFNYRKMIRARLLKGWTRTDLAFHCELHYSTISRMETGEHQNPATVKLAAEALGLSMTDVLIDGAA